MSSYVTARFTSEAAMTIKSWVMVGAILMLASDFPDYLARAGLQWFEGAPKIAVNTGPARFAVVTLSTDVQDVDYSRRRRLRNPDADASPIATFDGGRLDVTYQCIDCFDDEVHEFVQATFGRFPEVQIIEVTGVGGFQVTFTRAPATD
jgi:hypothetical protein